jgi:Holliday junction resolvasome RuvABC endonuclease subunit
VELQPVRVLALDVSSKTGYSLFEIADNVPVLTKYGVLQKTDLPKDVPYPEDYLQWAANTWREVESLIARFKPHQIAIEETAIKTTGSNAYSQKFLDWCHYHLATLLAEAVPPYAYTYYKTDEWRAIIGCNRMTDEDKRHNKLYRDLKKSKKGGLIKHPTTGKVISLVNKKALNIRKVNEVFGLSLIKKDEDIADAIGLGYAHCLRLTNKK